MLSVLSPLTTTPGRDRAYSTPVTPPASVPRPSGSRPNTPLSGATASSSKTPIDPPTAPTPGKQWRVSVGLTNDVEFVAANTAPVLGDGIEGKYKPINDSDMEISEPSSRETTPIRTNGKGKEKAVPQSNPAVDDEGTSERLPPVPSSPAARPSTPKIKPLTPTSSPTTAGPSSSPAKRKLSELKELYTDSIPTSWPTAAALGRGLLNVGNTCFLNSVLQCILYTPPLLHILIGHKAKCHVVGFCMVCSLQDVAQMNFSGRRGYFSPKPITDNLRSFAKGFVRGRQEDAHEFLRHLIEGCQKTAMAGLPPKYKNNHALAATTWVGRIFGMRIRSRVSCKECGFNSDTFEPYYDLSLELNRCQTVEQALAAFSRVEDLDLKGTDRWKCEKCKTPVDAQKQLSLHQVPTVLTVHLKRFTPMGRKIPKRIEYPDTLDVSPYVSEGEPTATYSLYGIISHSGSGPHSGHYVAYIKAPSGRWHEMNDDEIGPGAWRMPDVKDAYILFYLRNDAVPPSRPTPAKKRRIESDDEEEEGPERPKSLTPEPKVFGGPQIAKAAEQEQQKYTQAHWDIARKISELQQKGGVAAPVTSSVNASTKTATSAASKPRSLLVDYADEEEDVGEALTEAAPSSPTPAAKDAPQKKFIGPQLPNGLASAPSSGTLLASGLDTMNLLDPVKPTNFYSGSSSKSESALDKKRHSSSSENDDEPTPKHPKKTKGMSHYRGRMSGIGSNDLNKSREATPSNQRDTLKSRMNPKPHKKRSLM